MGKFQGIVFFFLLKYSKEGCLFFQTRTWNFAIFSRHVVDEHFSFFFWLKGDDVGPLCDRCLIETPSVLWFRHFYSGCLRGNHGSICNLVQAMDTKKCIPRNRCFFGV